MYKFNPKIFLWSSPLYCIDPERSFYHSIFLKESPKIFRLFFALVFLIRSLFTGLKQIAKNKIIGCKYISAREPKYVIYLPSAFLDISNKNCNYFPSAPKSCSYLVTDHPNTIPRNFISLMISLFGEITPVFRRINSSGSRLIRLSSWLIYLSYFLSLEVLSNYILACSVDSLCNSQSDIKHICLHEMHPYSRVVYGVSSSHDSFSIAIQHAFIHRTRLLFDIKSLPFRPYLPDLFFIWSTETLNQMISFGWSNDKFRFCASERYSESLLINENESIDNRFLSSNNKNSKIKSNMVLFIPSLLRADFYLCIQSAFFLRTQFPDLKLVIKFHPSFKLSVQDLFLILKLLRLKIKLEKDSIQSLSLLKPLTFAYSSTAIYESAFYGCSSFLIPTFSIFNKSELVLKDKLYSIVKDFLSSKILNHINDDLYISPERAYSFFGLNRTKMFSILDNDNETSS
tara:strand:- start:1938 stop:3308 length:1371 start_codon:yes stop_codon:yes gene_type:complete